MQKSLLLMIAIFMILQSCKKPAAEPSLQEMFFEVNPALIAGPVTLNALNITFHPPVHWEAVSDSMFREFSDFAAAQPGSGIIQRIEPAAVFINRRNQSVLIVSRVVTAEPVELNQIADEVEKRYDFDQGGVQLKRSRFTKDGILLEQLFMEDMLRVVVKLIGLNPMGQAVQLDFTVLKTEYNHESKAIESAIGTFMWSKQ